MSRISKTVKFTCPCGAEVERGATKKSAQLCLPCHRKLNVKMAYSHGDTFNNFSVVGASDRRRNNGTVLWNCLCVCGNEFLAGTSSIRNGKQTLSCGCLRYKRQENPVSESPEYKSYYMMLDRCYNSNCPMFSHYGGRGITVQESWRLPDGEGFRNFLTDLGPRPLGTSIERKDVNLGYTKENCKWATDTEQGHTRRKQRGTSSKYKGVSTNSSGGWRSYISKDKKRKELGNYYNEELAATVYDFASLLLYGDETYLNFPDKRGSYLSCLSLVDVDFRDILASAKRAVEMYEEWK